MNTRFEIINGKCEIPAGISEIEDMAFCDCQELREVVIPEGVKRIGSHAFCDCRSLKEVLLPDSLEIIDVCAFNSCYNLKKIRIPKSVKRVDNSAFRACTRLDRIDVDDENPYYKSVSNTFLTKDGKTLIFGCRSSEIPDGVEDIMPLAFWCMGLKSVNLPDSITTIGYWAFGACMNLKSINIPAGVKVIEIAALNCPLKDLFLASVKPDNRVDLSKALIGKKLGKITLHVPAGSEDLYRQHPFFKKFKNVVV